MNNIFKIVRSAQSGILWKPVSVLSYSNQQKTFCRSFHRRNQKLCIKMFMEHENKYAYDILESKGYVINISSSDKSSYTCLLSKQEFEENLKVAESKHSSPQLLFDMFLKFVPYVKKNNLCISNKIFDRFVDNFTDNIKKASDSELKHLFYVLNEWPQTESIRSRNFIEVWAALDDECFKRILTWTFDDMLSYLSLFYMLNVTRVSDYSQKCLQKLASKAKQLTSEQLVQTLFFVGVLRRSPFDMNNLEVELQNNFTKFTIDELAIISMGFFKSKTPLRNVELMNKIMEQISLHKTTINEVSLAALLKILRYSIRTNQDDRVYNLLEELQHEVPRLSMMCNVHLALLGMATLTYHKGCLHLIANNAIDKLPDIRMKDLERLVLTYGTFSYVPECKENFVDKILEELRDPKRKEEIEKHGRSFTCCVSFLGLLQVYPVDLIKKVLDLEFLNRTYGKNHYYYGKEVLLLNNIAEIFCKDADINFLPKNKCVMLAKKFTDFFPTDEYKKQYNASERMVLDLVRVLKSLRGGKEFVVGDHILTHHQRGDVILCNSQDGSPMPVSDYFGLKNFGLIKSPPDTNNRWIVLVIIGKNGLIKGSNKPTGPFLSKSRELKALGFFPALVPYNDYLDLNTDEEKYKYLSQLIQKATEG